MQDFSNSNSKSVTNLFIKLKYPSLFYNAATHRIARMCSAYLLLSRAQLGCSYSC